MKRLLAAGLLLCWMVSMTGCALLDYQKANTLYEEGEYAQAKELYASLGDFADSADMLLICETRADYAQAQALYAAGNYAQALAIYRELDMYADSPRKAVMCQYELGKTCMAAENYQEAITWLEPLGNYENSADQLNLAKWNWIGQQRHTKVMDAGAGRNRTLSLQMPEAETLVVKLSDAGLLLGLPYKTEYEMTLVRGNAEAAYTLKYNSANVNTITETAAGTVELHRFAEGLPVAEFTQTIIDAEGVTTKSTDVQNAIMTKMLLEETVAVVLEQLPQLLAMSGVDISITDLGF